MVAVGGGTAGVVVAVAVGLNGVLENLMFRCFKETQGCTELGGVSEDLNLGPFTVKRCTDIGLQTSRG
ncbi:MAG: hypothetical protein NWF14_03005 [Candidatus Bathyarchaeota archaeon]|nr:hypothetical protein [Candidatus Bathyarchaeota archaeon]